MRVVAQVLLAPIAPDFRVDHELEVNAVAVAGDVVFFNHCTRAFPEVDAVAAVLFLFQSGDTRTYPCISCGVLNRNRCSRMPRTPRGQAPICGCLTAWQQPLKTDAHTPRFGVDADAGDGAVGFVSSIVFTFAPCTSGWLAVRSAGAGAFLAVLSASFLAVQARNIPSSVTTIRIVLFFMTCK